MPGCCCCRRRCCWWRSRTIRSWPRSGIVFFIARRNGTEVFVGLDNYQAMFARPDLLEGAGQQFLVRARHRPDLDRAGAADGAVGQPQHARPRLPAACLFHADRAADDRGRQHLAVLLHAGLRPARSVARPVRPARLELARRSPHRDGLPDRDGDLEGGRLLHDLLSRSAAAAFARSRGGRGGGRRRPLVHLPAHYLSAADADHAVRRDQRGHQFLQAGRSPRHHDQGRSEQCQYAAAVLHLRSRLHVPGFRPTRRR